MVQSPQFLELSKIWDKDIIQELFEESDRLLILKNPVPPQFAPEPITMHGLAKDMGHATMQNL